MTPLTLLATGVASYRPYLQSSGELHDPVFGEPTQYGTAYHAFCHAVLATAGPVEARATHLSDATRGLDATLTHTGNPTLTPSAAGFSRATGAVRRSNHRDFTWPPILKTYRILAAEGVDRSKEFAERIAAVDIEQSFRSRPPSNWASVWLAGEWVRIREGLSTYTRSDVDGWLGGFLDDLLRPDDGFFFEPGKPNSYDLFTRFHVADLLWEGYDGRWQGELERLMETGLERSLAVQMSDGSLASAHRSTGQTWTVGAEIAYFTHAANFFAERDDNDRAQRAADGARLAFASMQRWQRPGAPFSPVENLLPPGFRVGYEGYTADGHYGNLALAFLATAVLAGFGSDELPATEPAATRDAATRVEHEPTFRGVAHAGRYSLALNADPAPAYDGFGTTDLTVGPRRHLQFASSVKHMESGAFVNLGLARRTEPGRSALDILAQRTFTLTQPIEALPPTSLPSGAAGLSLRATSAATETPTAQPGLDYELTATVRPDGVEVTEATPGLVGYRTLLVPYVRDTGTGIHTTVEQTADGVRLVHGDETVAVTVDGTVEAIVVLPHGFENRRGLCGLVRLDLDEPADRISYRVFVVR